MIRNFGLTAGVAVLLTVLCSVPRGQTKSLTLPYTGSYDAWTVFNQIIRPGQTPELAWDTRAGQKPWCAIADTAAGLETLSCGPSPAVKVAATALSKQLKRQMPKHLLHLRQRLGSSSDMAMPPDRASPKVLSEVVFNPAASRYLEKIAKGDGTQSIAGRLQRLLTAAPQGGVANLDSLLLDSLPPGSIAVKTIWLEIPTNVSPTSPAFFPALKGEGKSITATLSINETQRTSCDPPAGSRLVPLGCFYFVAFDRNDLAKLTPIESSIVKGFDDPPPYYLLLLGFHVMKRIGGQWTWQTFWWDAEGMAKVPDQTWLAQHGNPHPSASHLKYYYADTDPPGDITRQVYNPYIERGSPSGSDLNCLRCHSLAAFHPDSPTQPGQLGQMPDCYLKQAQAKAMNQPVSVPCPTATTGPVQTLTTDQLWTLADSNDTIIHKPRQ